MNTEPNQVTIEATEGPLSTKFQGNTAKLEQAYVELERKLSGAVPDSVGTTEETSTEDRTPPEEEVSDSSYGEAIIAAVTGAGLDIKAVQQEFNSEEGLKPETREGLDKAFGKDVVEAYLRGVKSATADVNKEVTEVSSKIVQAGGGEDNLATIQQWSMDNRPDLVDSFNAALDANNLSVLPVITEAMKSAYENTNGSLVTKSIKDGAVPASGAAKAFRSTTEMIEAMGDPRYKSDPAFREEVTSRLKVTKFG